MMGNPIILSAACLLLPILDRPHDGVVSVEIAQTQGEMCVRIGNGTPDPVHYQHGNGWLMEPTFRIERENGGRWDYISGHISFPQAGEGKPLAAGEIRYHAVPHHELPTQPDRYRGCLQFFTLHGHEEDRQERCSAPFLLSPKELRSHEKRP